MLVVFAQGRTRNLEQRTLRESNHGRSCVQIKIRSAATTRPFVTVAVFAFINNICLDAQIRTFSCIFVYLVGRSRSGFCVLVVENVIPVVIKACGDKVRAHLGQGRGGMAADGEL